MTAKEIAEACIGTCHKSKPAMMKQKMNFIVENVNRLTGKPATDLKRAVVVRLRKRGIKI